MKKTNTIEVVAPPIRTKTILIEGTGDLVLNKMNAPTVRALTDARKDKAKSLEKPNYWEEVITSMHWYNGTPSDFSEEGMERALVENAPCISGFGLKKSLGDAVVRAGIDQYKTKFDANVNIIAKNNLIPVKFAQHFVDEKLMSPKKGAPVLAKLNRFTGWTAQFDIQFLENVYSLEQIVNIINMAGFGIGIGSGRSSGYGRYKVVGII